MKMTLSVNILRLGLLLVLIGFFAPVGCDSNGYQIALGILGNTHQAGNARILGSIEDLFGYALFGVCGLAFLGLVFKFFYKVKRNFFFSSMCLAMSFILLAIVALKLKSFRDSTVVNLMLTIIPIKLKLLIGGYSMAAGYLVGAVGLMLRKLKM
jgi:hypothetical protein